MSFFEFGGLVTAILSVITAGNLTWVYFRVARANPDIIFAIISLVGVTGLFGLATYTGIKADLILYPIRIGILLLMNIYCYAER